MSSVVTKDFGVLARFVREVNAIEAVVPEAADLTEGGTLRSLRAASGDELPPVSSMRRHVLNSSGRYSIINPRTRPRKPLRA